jgi:3-hydroxyacyl-[acyl-carrier-protein] dehydratase
MLAFQELGSTQLSCRIQGDPMILDTNGIQKILPHRYPFLMVDAILEMERLKWIVGVKNVSINESFFQGHFPGRPILPGVLIIEAMAQTGGLLLLLEIPDREHKLLYFVAVDDARFRRPVVPGEQLRLEVTVVSWRGDFCKLRGKATVNGELACEATLMCKMVDREPATAPATGAASGNDSKSAAQPAAMAESKG